MQGQLPPGIELIKVDDFKEWLVDLRVLDANPLYENEVYRLKFTFSSKYPIGTPPIPLTCRAKPKCAIC